MVLTADEGQEIQQVLHFFCFPHIYCPTPLPSSFWQASKQAI
jgi:hypothetical protein